MNATAKRIVTPLHALPKTRLVIDFETFYDTEYSLSKMSPTEYILDRRFEVIGASVRIDTHELDGTNGACVGDISERARFIEGPDLPKFFAQIPWNDIAVVSHNGPFDFQILAIHYGIIPGFYIDTLAMARAFVFAWTGRAGLARVMAHFGLPAKGNAVINARGWTYAMFKNNPAKFLEYKQYCNRDTDGCSWLVDKLGCQMPGDEFLLVDMLMRMVTQPQLMLNTNTLTEYHAKIVRRKAALVASLVEDGVLDADNPRDTLLSADRFAKLLESYGVEVPMKKNAKGQLIYAFAKTDKPFTALAEHGDEDVQALIAARLGTKSTQEETRSARFINVASLDWTPVHASALALRAPALIREVEGVARIAYPALPFPLRFSGGHTHRFSGDFGWNLQNLQRPNADLGREAALRASIEAPPGYKIVAADASQIEARVVSELAGAKRITNGFATGEDVYSTFAAMVYGHAINKKEHPVQRFVGKTGVLGLGFGMGPPKFVVTCWNQGKKVIELPLSARVVKTYRKDFAPEVPVYWGRMERLIQAMCRGESAVDGPLTVQGQQILLPNGLWLYYRDLVQLTNVEKNIQVVSAMGDLRDITVTGSEYRFVYGNETNYLFGGKLTENIVQALARIITMSAAVRIRRDWKIRHPLAGQVHDQLIYVVPDSEAEAMAHALVHAMRIPPKWLPNLPLDAEAGIGQNLRDLEEIKVPKLDYKSSPRFAMM